MYYSMAQNERNWVNSLAYKRMDEEEEKEETRDRRNYTSTILSHGDHLISNISLIGSLSLIDHASKMPH
jgi:hypothetical protein